MLKNPVKIDPIPYFEVLMLRHKAKWALKD